MSTVADHTVLRSIATTPLFGDVLLQEYARDRRILVVPATAMMEAARQTADRRNLSELFTKPAVVKWIDIDPSTAYQIGSRVPTRNGDWGIVAPVVWAAQVHGIPILSAEPDRYRGYGIPTVTLP